MHADSAIDKAGEKFVIKAGEVKLLVEPKPNVVDARVETNVVTAPGPPGAVDKGERQERGQKLVLTTSRPATSVSLVMRLKIE